MTTDKDNEPKPEAVDKEICKYCGKTKGNCPNGNKYCIFSPVQEDEQDELFTELSKDLHNMRMWGEPTKEEIKSKYTLTKKH
jgi:hypothetical protein